jgi:hypothetical protein
MKDIKLTDPQKRLIKDIYRLRGSQCKHCLTYKTYWVECSGPMIRVARSLWEKYLVFLVPTPLGVKVSPTPLFWTYKFKWTSFLREVE